MSETLVPSKESLTITTRRGSAPAATRASTSLSSSLTSIATITAAATTPKSDGGGRRTRGVSVSHVYAASDFSRAGGGAGGEEFERWRASQAELPVLDLPAYSRSVSECSGGGVVNLGASFDPLPLSATDRSGFETPLPPPPSYDEVVEGDAQGATYPAAPPPPYVA